MKTANVDINIIHLSCGGCCLLRGPAEFFLCLDYEHKQPAAPNP